MKHNTKLLQKLHNQSRKRDLDISRQLSDSFQIENPLKLIQEMRDILTRSKNDQIKLHDILQKEISLIEDAEKRQFFTEENILLIAKFVQEVIYSMMIFKPVPFTQSANQGIEAEADRIKGSGWLMVQRDGKNYIVLKGSFLPLINEKFKDRLFEILEIDFCFDEVVRTVKNELSAYGLQLLHLSKAICKSFYPIPRQIIENQLHYTKPGQLTFFDQLIDAKVREKVVKAKDGGELVTEGIKPTASEERLLKALYKMIKPRLSSGSLQYDGQDSIGKIAILAFTPTELYEAYELEKLQNKRQLDYSGSDRETVRNALISLSEKKFLIRYYKPLLDEHGNPLKRNGEQRYRVVESYTSLYNIVSSIEDITSSEWRNSEIVEKKTMIRLYINPILLDQIDKNYINYPTDIFSQIKLVYRKQRVPDYLIQFINYLIDKYHIHKKNGYVHRYHEVNFETIAYVTGLQEYYEKKRKQRFQDCLSNMFGVAKDIGLAHSVHTEIGAMGQLKARIEFNFEYL